MSRFLILKRGSIVRIYFHDLYVKLHINWHRINRFTCQMIICNNYPVEIMQTSSLVKYHSPILVSITNAKGKNNKNATKKPAVVEKTATTQTEDILNSILPPRYVIVNYKNRCSYYSVILLFDIMMILYFECYMIRVKFMTVNYGL